MAKEIERGIVSVESICTCVFIIGLATRNAFIIVVGFVFVVKALHLELTLLHSTWLLYLKGITSPLTTLNRNKAA